MVPDDHAVGPPTPGPQYAWLESFAQAIPDLMFEVSRDGIFLDFKSSAGADPALAPQRFIGRKLDDMLPAELARRARGAAANALRTGHVQTLECRLPRPGENGRDCEARVVATRARTVLVALRDVTDHKRLAAKMCYSEQWLQQLLLASPAAIYTFEVAEPYRVSFISGNVVTQVGYDAQEFLDDPAFWLAHVHPDDRQRVVDTLADLPVLGRFACEYRFRHRDGSWRWMRDEARVLPGAKEGTAEAAGVWFDVTDAKRREHALGAARDDLEQRVAQRTAELSATVATLSANAWELERANETLRQQALIFANSTDALFILDLQRRIVDWNPACERLFGYRKHEVLGKTTRSLYPSDDYARQSQVIEAAIARGEVWSSERFMLRKDGSKRFCETIRVPLLDANGALLGRIGVSRDITEQKRAEALLRGEKRALETMASGAPLATILETIAQAVETVSSGMLCSILLLDADGVHLRHGAAPSLPDDYNRAIDGVAIGPNVGSCGTSAFRNQQVIVTDIATDPLWTDYCTLALPHRLRACWSTPIRSGEGKVLGTFALYYGEPRAPTPDDLELIERMTHLTSIAIERRRADEAQARLAAIVEQSCDAIIGRSIDGTILSWNAGAEHVLGYTAVEVIGRDLVDTVLPDLRHESAVIRARIRAGESFSNYETERITKNGHRIDVAISGAPIKDERGAIIGTANILRDITERKQAEKQLHDYAARLQAVSRKLLEVQENERRTIARELHDRVGQELTALSLNLTVIHNALPAAAARVVGARIDDAQALLESTTRHLRDVLADLRPPGLDELGLYASLREHARQVARQGGFKLKLAGAEPAPFLPLAVEIALFRIAQEALHNVAKHAHATTVSVSLRQTSSAVTLTVADNGGGFKVAAAKGIGTATMLERVEAIGARLRVESAARRGTRVIVELPHAAISREKRSRARPRI